MNQTNTLESLKGRFVVVNCSTCRLEEKIERKALIRKFSSEVTLARLRRTMVGRCEKMCDGGADGCIATLTSLDLD